MKHPTAATLLSLTLFASTLVMGKGPVAPSSYPDSLPSVWFYTEGIKQNSIYRDSVRARKLFHEAIARDSSYAPAYYELAANGLYSTPDEVVELTRRAHLLDTTNRWYHQSYGQALVYAGRYDEALKVYRSLQLANPKEPDNYRMLAALYEERKNPIMALITLDSAEMRFGQLPVLSVMKRRLLVESGQTDRALREAREQVEAAPYEVANHVVLGDLYALSKKDSLALASYDKALQLEPDNVQALMALSDYYANHGEYLSLLAVTRQLFQSDEMPLESKIKRFGQYTSDTNFYREYYLQLNDLATILAIRYPNDPRVVRLYANHLIASGELDQALTLYKNHLNDTPPVESYYRAVIDIESYLQHPDSVDHYVTQALRHFPSKVEFHISRGHVMSYGKSYDRAVDAYKESLHYADTDSLRSVIWGMIGDTWHQKALAETPEGEEETLHHSRPSKSYRRLMQECYRAYDRSLDYWKDNPVVLNNYAYFLSLEKRDLERALNMSGRVLVLTDNNPTYLDTHGWVLFALGRTDEAKKMLQKAVALDGQKSPELMVHYGDILHLLGEQFMAEVYWRRALEKGYDADRIAARFKQPATVSSEE